MSNVLTVTAMTYSQTTDSQENLGFMTSIAGAIGLSSVVLTVLATVFLTSIVLLVCFIFGLLLYRKKFLKVQPTMRQIENSDSVHATTSAKKIICTQDDKVDHSQVALKAENPKLDCLNNMDDIERRQF